MNLLTLFLNDIALGEWITSKSYLARAKRSMIDNLANSVVSAESWTRILTFGPDASSVCRAVRIDNTFWSTPFVRVANVIREALARRSAILFVTDCV